MKQRPTATLFAVGLFIEGLRALCRSHGLPFADVGGSQVPGYSFGQAIAAIERIVSEILSFTHQGKQAGKTVMYVFPLSVVPAFLILTAVRCLADRSDGIAFGYRGSGVHRS